MAEVDWREVVFQQPMPELGGDAQPGYGHMLKPGADMSHGVALYLDDISVSFDGFRALNKLSLSINTGELRCIIGPNGAGKTTMMDVITGKTRPDEGTVFFGQTIDLLKLREAEVVEAGIGRKFQKPTVFEQMSVPRPPMATQMAISMELAVDISLGLMMPTCGAYNAPAKPHIMAEMVHTPSLNHSGL